MLVIVSVMGKAFGMRWLRACASHRCDFEGLDGGEKLLVEDSDCDKGDCYEADA